MPDLKLTLLDNSKRFLVEALRKALLAEKDPGEWPFAILSLVQSIELALKELLKREHSILIYKNVDDPKHTVTLDVAVQRLKKISGIVLSDGDLNSIKTAAEFRNQIVHFEFAFETKELKLVFARLFGFLREFYLSRLDEELDSFIPEALWLEGIAVHEYGAELFLRAKNTFSEKGYAEEFIITCPKCGWDALSAWDDINTCYVCGHQEDLVVCGRCGLVVKCSEALEIGKRSYCNSCHEYLVDDFWHEDAREREC